ncbi:hypothetical protein, partial [Thiolapillus sp.]|uniref:hypothetical protein n=1 Tax=Thiolapillus sp. TaxID=2017437 RepID=UPI003AF92D91
RSEAYFVFPLAQGTPGKQCGLAATGVYQPSLRSPWLAAVDAGQRARRCCGFFRLEQSPGTGMGVPVLHGEKISPQRGRRADI